MVDLASLRTLFGPGAPDPDLAHSQFKLVSGRTGYAKQQDGLAGLLKSKMLICHCFLSMFGLEKNMEFTEPLFLSGDSSIATPCPQENIENC